MSGFIIKPEGLSSEFLRTGEGATDWARIEDGLRRENILQSSETMTAFEDVEPWHRGGAETFIADAMVGVSPGSSGRRVIAKALVSFATDLDTKLRVWLRRRSLLSGIGIPVPFLFNGRNATVFEEFIDEPFRLTDSDSDILDQVGKIGAQLDFNGFTTLSFLSDLRVKDQLVYYVDFGTDLGEPSGARTESARLTLVKSIPASQIDSCLRAYDGTLIDLG